MVSVEEPVPAEPEAETSQNHLFQELQVAIKELMTLVNIPLQEVWAGAAVWGGGRGRAVQQRASHCGKAGYHSPCSLFGDLKHCKDFRIVQGEGKWWTSLL